MDLYLHFIMILNKVWFNLKWTIEFINGKKIIENIGVWDLSNKHLIKRIYFTDGNNEFGFFMNGNFFINNKTFNFKIKIDNIVDIDPFQYKTGMLQFAYNINKNNIIAWNIGYKIKYNENYEYIMIINPNYEIFFKAIKKDLNDNIIDIKEIKLQ